MGVRRRGGGGAALVAAAAVLLVPNLVQAQASPAAGAEGLSREQLNPAGRAPPARASDRDLFQPEPPGPCPLRGSDLKLTLKSVAFKGLTAATEAEMRSAYADLIGREASVEAICDIRDRAARMLFDRGVLARVEIPEQRIVDGILTLQVIEARIVNVRVRSDVGPGQAQVEAYLAKLRGMTPFDLRKAQRYLLLASDVPGMRVRATLKPSTVAEPGAVDLDVVVERTAMAATVNVQNFEAETLGRWGGLVRADFNGFTPLGERSSLVFYHSLEADRQWVLEALEEARFGSEGLIGRLSLVYGQSRPAGTLAALALQSDAFVGNLELSYPLIRLRRRNLNLAAGFDWVDEKTIVTGAGTLNEDRLRIFYARIDGDARPRLAGRALDLGAAMEFRKGVEGLGATRADSLTLSRVGAQPDSFVVRLSGHASAALIPNVSLSARAQAQYASDPLLSFEQLSVGNLTIGRGYDPSSRSGDSGVAAAFDLRFGPFAINPRVVAAPYVFYDVAYTHDRLRVDGERTLTSVGAGVQFRLANRLNLDVFYARPLDTPVVGTPRPESRVLVNLTASF